MFQLVYISSATPGMGEREVAGILRVSRRNNALGGVTGLLLHDGRRFLQALEGDTVQVTAIYDRIKGDHRHRGVVVLSSRDVMARAFGEWAMAAQPIVAGGMERAIVAQVDTLTAGVEDANLRETFRSFARVRAAA